jgi:TatD DNase family protein
MQNLTDTHAHLSRLENGVVDDLFNAGFGIVLDIGTAANDLADRVKLLGHFKNVYFAAGIWPYAASCKNRESEIAILEKQIEGASLSAIGECGFDRRENPSAPHEETELFEMQLDIAKRHSLPIIIHSRDAPLETIETLEKFKTVRGIIHCFSYSAVEAKKFLDMGYYISFAGNLTYKNAHNLKDAITYIPKDRLLLETDSPFLSPVPHRGKPCNPAMIIETYKTASELTGINLEELINIIAQNTKNILKIK